MIRMSQVREYLTRHEGKRNRPYRDTMGYWTIGVGHDIDANPLPPDIQDYLKNHDEITDEMIDRLLCDDVDIVVEHLEKIFDFYHFSDNRQLALIDITFNVGPGVWKGIAANYIRKGNWEAAANRISTWKYCAEVGHRAQENIQLLREG